MLSSFPKFALKNRGTEQLKKNLSRYRSTKQILKQLFVERFNYAASDAWLHSKLFAEKTKGLRLIWEYTNMMFLSLSSEGSLNRFVRERTKIAELNAFTKNSTHCQFQKRKR